MKAILSKASLTIVGQVLGFVVLLVEFTLRIRSHGQVVATWTDGNGIWITVRIGPPASQTHVRSCPTTAAENHDVVITPNVSVTFDASGTVVSALELSGNLQDDGHSADPHGR